MSVHIKLKFNEFANDISKLKYFQSPLRGSTEIVIHRGRRAISSAMNERKAALFSSLHGQGECLPIFNDLVNDSRTYAQASRTYKFKKAIRSAPYCDEFL